MPPANAMPASTPSPDDDLEQRVAFESIRGRLFDTLGQPVTIGRFVVTGRLGQGGMGVVYEAYDPRLDRKVAVKVLRDSGDAAHAASARRSLEREARAAAGLSHPNVVTVYDSGTVGDGVYVAMELVRGSTLRAWLETPRRWLEIVRMFLEAGRGLQAAHEAGLVHCDFKPDNVLVGEDARPRVLDFGLVRSMRPARTAGPVQVSRAVTAPHSPVGTSTGTSTVVGGTLAFMPPEQREGKAEARSDQYAFCVALYRALFGVHPYDGDGDRLARTHERRGVPRVVVRAIVKGLAQEIGLRHASMTVLIDQLQRALRWRARLPWVAGGVVLLGVAGVPLHAAMTFDPCAGTETELRAVWSDEARDAVTRSLAAAGAPDEAEMLTQRLDHYAQAWSAMRRESCVATHTGGQSGELFELRAACLDRRRNTFGSAVERLQRLSLGQGEQGRSLVERLQPIDDCAGHVLRSEIAVRGMTESHTDRSRSPAANAAFVEVAGLLDDSRTEQLLGTHADALVLAQRAEARAQQMGLRYLEAEAIEQKVTLQLGAGEVDSAEAELHRALMLAVQANDSDVATAIVVRLLSAERSVGSPWPRWRSSSVS